MDTEKVTTKIERAALKQLKIIAALTGEQMTHVLRRLIEAELARLQRQEREQEQEQPL